MIHDNVVDQVFPACVVLCWMSRCRRKDRKSAVVHDLVLCLVHPSKIL